MKVYNLALCVVIWWIQVVSVVTRQMPELVCRTIDRPQFSLYSSMNDKSCQDDGNFFGRHYFSIYGQKITVFYDTNTFEMSCTVQTALDSLALPFFTTELKVNNIRLFNCLMPSNGESIQGALSALNVSLLCDTAPCNMELTIPHALPTINVSHFDGLDTLKALKLKGFTGAADFLATLPNLRSFQVFDVALNLDAVLSPSLFYLTVQKWYLKSYPTRLSRCNNLQYLKVSDLLVSSLPSRWVAACPHLQVLKLFGAHKIKELPQELLANTTELIEFQMENGGLEKLPHDIFHHSPKLRSIKLGMNALTTLPSEVFLYSGALRILDLTENQLNSSALEVFNTPSLKELLELYLDRNPTLKDLCDTSQDSKLSSLKKLDVLSLTYNNIVAICRDWRTSMHLKTLDLASTKISKVQLKDLKFDHAGNVSVSLWGAPLSSLQFDEFDYDTDPSSKTLGNVSLQLLYHMKCDCYMYWTWRTLKDGRWPTNLDIPSPILCDTAKGTRLLKDLVEEDLLCAANASMCGVLPDGCTCRSRPAKGASQHLRVSCEHTALTALPPQLRNITYSVDLLLGHNNISQLHREALPPNLKKLNISNNNLQSLDLEAVTSLVDEGRRLYISANPLTCSCEHMDALEVLLKHSEVVDYTDVTCANGMLLTHFTFECDVHPAPLGLILGTSLAAILAFTFAVIACLVRRNTRLYAAVLLDRLGLLRWRDDTDDDRFYDVFVSFSHGDEQFMLEIVRWLEDRSPPYRLCLHYRDWVPGRTIPEQISSSVVNSRRTLALVSSNFLKSTWARAEFREAHAQALRDVTRRLVVILLEDKNSLELDEELRRYLAVNTYLQWGDTWFWDKLKIALPRPRPRSPSHSPSPSLSRVVPLPLLSIEAVPFNDNEYNTGNN